jgi:hypothetical protein
MIFGTILMNMVNRASPDLLILQSNDILKAALIHSLDDVQVDLKILACKSIVILTEKCKDRVTLFAPTLIECVVKNFSHQRSEVRIFSLRAFCHLVVCNAGSYLEKLENALIQLGEIIRGCSL